MKLSIHSKWRLTQSFRSWEVPEEYSDTLENYLVHGYATGGFFTSLLANDGMNAILRSHPANTIESLKSVVRWLTSNFPPNICFGSYEVVNAWMKLSGEERRAHLESQNLIYSVEEETLKILRGDVMTLRAI